MKGSSKQAFRERIRLEAAKQFAAGASDAEVAKASATTRPQSRSVAWPSDCGPGSKEAPWHWREAPRGGTA